MHRSYREIAIGTPSAPHGRMATIAPLVAPAWLEEHIDDPDLRIVDATVQITPEFQIASGREDWRKEHIPRSTFADLLELSSPDAPPFTFTWPEPDWFASHMGQLGVGEGTRVVLYDRRENMWAARLWWMLRAFGFEDAAVLDGGWTSWKLEKRRTCGQPCSYPPATFLARPREGLIVRKHEVLAAIGDPKTSIVDALGRKSHTGEVNEYGRPGHIPERATSRLGGSSIAPRSAIARSTSSAPSSATSSAPSGSSRTAVRAPRARATPSRSRSSVIRMSRSTRAACWSGPPTLPCPSRSVRL